MSLEGRLRDLALPEVLQLLGLSRKTGTLHLQAQVQGRAAFVRLTNGAVVDAAQWRLVDGISDVPAGLATSDAPARMVEDCVLDLLAWRDGDFAFAPAEGASLPSKVRIAVEMLLMASAQRAEGWERVADRIANARVVPTFVDVEPQQLPLLRLVPQQWEILTQVDGNRDLTELAAVLGRELLDVAEIVHGLIGAGLLALREAELAPRRNPTPPIGATAWVDDASDEDSLFDPTIVGGASRVGMPQFRTTPRGVTAVAAHVSTATAVAVAPVAPETSVLGVGESGLLRTTDAAVLSTQGDMAAQRGDLPGAVAFWSAALQSDASHPDADRIREAMVLASRLHALLHSAERRT